jgi:hypothetical protein
MADTKEEIERAMAALRHRLPNPLCPLCQGTSWSAGTIELQPVNGFPYKALQLICGKCGFTSMHDLEVLGLR